MIHPIQKDLGEYFKLTISTLCLDYQCFHVKQSFFSYYILEQYYRLKYLSIHASSFYCENIMPFFTLQTPYMISVAAILRISLRQPFLFVALINQSFPFFHSIGFLVYPIHCIMSFHIVFLMLQSKNKWSRDFKLLQKLHWSSGLMSKLGIFNKKNIIHTPKHTLHRILLFTNTVNSKIL